MKIKLLYITILLSLLFSACRKDIDNSSIDDLNFPDPVLLNVTLNGTLHDEFGAAVPQSVVRLYKGEFLIQSQTSNEAGQFTFTNISFEDEALYLWSEPVGYDVGFKKHQMTGALEEEVSIQVIKDNTYGDLTNTFSPGDTDFIIVNGFVKDANNNSAKAVCAAYDLTGNLFSYSLTDANGHYEVLVPKNEAFNLDINSVCSQNIHNGDFPARTEDLSIEDLESTSTGEAIRIFGQVLNSAGNTVSQGYVRINTNTIPTVVSIENDGSFEFKTFDCLVGSNVSVHVYNSFNIETSMTISQGYDGSGLIDFGNIITDTDITANNLGVVSFNIIGQGGYGFNGHWAYENNAENTSILRGNNPTQFVDVVIDNFSGAMERVTFIKLVQGDEVIFESTEEGSLMLDIQEYIPGPDGRIRVEITGSVENNISGAMEDIEINYFVPILF